jgi:hypothetical protein
VAAIALVVLAAAMILYGLFGQKAEVISGDGSKSTAVRGADLVVGAVRRTIKLSPDGRLVADEGGAVECPT